MKSISSMPLGSSVRIRSRGPVAMSIGFFAILFAAYATFQASDVLFRPELELSTPSDGAAIRGTVTISGRTEPHLIVVVNGYQIQSDETGNFTDTLFLTKGFHKLDIEVENRFGRVARTSRDVVVE